MLLEKLKEKNGRKVGGLREGGGNYGDFRITSMTYMKSVYYF